MRHPRFQRHRRSRHDAGPEVLGATAVTRILTRCSKTNEPIPTGLDSDMVVLETLPNVLVPVVCPACGSTHYWMGFAAWVEWEEERQLVNAPSAARNIGRRRRAS